jgi:integrator complex subunit 11
MNSSNEEIIEVEPLGAGQDVGRSCVIVRLRDKKIMFDVGVHMVYTDMKRLPDFDYLKKGKHINEVVDVVLVTHFHLDHCGALPYLTEHHKYSGPILCSTPTKSMLYYMLDDYRKVVSDQKTEAQSIVNYTVDEIRHCVDMVRPIALYETVDIDGVKITSYYAGHVLGASMFHVSYQGLSVVYTGDYNSNSDRHLGAAYIPRLRPNVVLTETTYATTIRDSKRDRERDMLRYINETLDRGGKVLIPVFALGRAQELCVLL